MHVNNTSKIEAFLPVHGVKHANMLQVNTFGSLFSTLGLRASRALDMITFKNGIIFRPQEGKKSFSGSASDQHQIIHATPAWQYHGI